MSRSPSCSPAATASQSINVYLCQISFQDLKFRSLKIAILLQTNRTSTFETSSCSIKRSAYYQCLQKMYFESIFFL